MRTCSISFAGFLQSLSKFDISVISGPTDSDGTFVDDPIGVCGGPDPFPADARATYKQNLYILIGQTRFLVRTNNFDAALKSSCIDQTNGLHINVKNCP
jgi:hypothetical protein